MTARPNHYMGPRALEILHAFQELPPGTPRRRAADQIGCSYYSLNSVIRNARRAGVFEDLTVEDALAEATFLTDCGVPWAEAARRAGIIPRSRLSGAVNELRRSA